MFLFLFLLGFATSFIGTNTGGSSLITIPAMIAYGLPPQIAIACARVTSIGTLIAGIKAFHAKNKVDYKTAFPAAIMSLIGSSIGAIIMTHLSSSHLNHVIGILTLCLLSIPFIFRRKKVISKHIPRYKKWIGYSLFLFTSVLGGFYGGQGLITTYLFVIFFNKTISESAGTRKISALGSAIAPCIIYGFHDFINWFVVAALMSGTILGATLGARYALKKGDVWMQRVFMIVASLLAVKLLAQDVF